MQWSPEQSRALDAVAKWFSSGDEQVFYLAGYAGTGKTTLARHFAEQCGGQVMYGAFTGKAAYVMRQKGCLGATTIHKMIYKPKDKSGERLRELHKKLADLIDDLSRREVADVEGNHGVQNIRREISIEEDNLRRPAFGLDPTSPVSRADLLIIDECSMIDDIVGDDLMSFGTKLLVLGDPAQLPPVKGAGYFTSRRPDFQLTEIHRQARDNPIIALATTVREGGRLELGRYGESRVIRWGEVGREECLGADQILVGTNKFRRNMNQKMREILGHAGPLPVRGDRLVCLRNDHEVGLLNGGLWSTLTCMGDVDDQRVALEVESIDESQRVTCEAHVPPFLGEDVPWYEMKEAQHFDYGYALTCHKAQGSQWDSVMVFDQSGSFPRADQPRWLYTALTRAAERVTVAIK